MPDQTPATEHSTDSKREYRLFSALDCDGDGQLDAKDLRAALAATGLRLEDPRLREMNAQLEALGREALSADDFAEVIRPVSVLIERALQGGLAIPDFDEFGEEMRRVYREVEQNERGAQADYIPPLAEVNPDQFGLAIVTVDGQILTIGDADTDFSIQSTCKPFNYCYALEELGDEGVHKHIGREPSGQRFNAYVLQENNNPHNPMINAGAIMCAALIKQSQPLHRRFEHVRESWARMTAGRKPRYDAYMAQEEARTGDRNRALAYMMKNEGSFPGGEDAEVRHVEAALSLYFRACSLELTAREMATAAATLANGGTCPISQDNVLSQRTVRNCLSLMYSCGMYDYSGEFAFSIGLPAKSGVGGAVLLVVPGLMGVCTWSPRLDHIGNSVRGVDFAKRLVQAYSLHLFDTLSSAGERIDPRESRIARKAKVVSEALWAASTGDLRTIKRLQSEGVDLERGDYDQRTPLHLAAAEGHADVVAALLDAGVNPTKDRWGGTPLDDAEKGEHAAVVALLKEHGVRVGPAEHVADDTAPAPEPADHGDQNQVIQLLWAAASGDITGLQRMVALGVPLHAADYDGRTAMHLAAAEGQLAAVEYLLAHEHPLGCRDRWGATPLDEARREGRDEVTARLAAARAAAS
ncbi:MAG: glutaminase A [Myxococcales bacterium]|nr:glutaminase A [Myxococcales bacterium]